MRARKILLMVAITSLAISACGAVEGTPAVTPIQEEQENVEMTTPYDKNYTESKSRDVIYLAGGCFWGLEKLMQSIAAENNLPETAFFVEKGGVFEIRWFTPACEVSMCGHATIAAASPLPRHVRSSSTRSRVRTQTR